jgi:hypothetical protein
MSRIGTHGGRLKSEFSNELSSAPRWLQRTGIRGLA